jgi:predicted O-methyltransferase YrrM
MLRADISRGLAHLPEAAKAVIRFWLPNGLLTMYRQRAMVHRDLSSDHDVQFALPEKTLQELLPGIEQLAVTLPVSEIVRPESMVLPLPELLTLAAICRFLQPRRIFEFGTYTGSSTLLLATHSPEDAEVYTVDLDAAELESHRHGMGTGLPAFTRGAAFAGKSADKKIRQLVGASQTLDLTFIEKSVDLVFVDADHSYAFVKSDSMAAFRLLRSGGVIVWDDYKWLPQHAECAGVTRCLNELGQDHEVFQVSGTRLAVYVDPAVSSPAPR